jgi:hypothetical protein
MAPTALPEADSYEAFLALKSHSFVTVHHLMYVTNFVLCVISVSLCVCGDKT